MEQISIFDCLYENYKIKKPIRIIELFAGIGSQSKALENLNANFEHWKICEWAIPSILAYSEIHQDYLPKYKLDFTKDMTKEDLIDYLYNIGVSSNYNEPMRRDQIKRLSECKLKSIYNAIKRENNLVNISTTKGEDLEIIDTDKYDYIMSYSFPCQDLSISGKMCGMSRDGGTRSGLLWQVERLLKECKELPQVLLMENVPQVIGEKNIKDFQEWQAQLDTLGYTSYCEILNAKDYGVPQNRDRCFMVSILGKYNYNFPKIKKLNLELENIIDKNYNENLLVKTNTLKKIENINHKKQKDIEIINKILKGTHKKFEVFDIRMDEGIRIRNNGLCPTLTTRSCASITGVPIFYQDGKLRYISQKESYKLMGFTELDEERASKVISDSMIFHTAGDSIVVNVLMAIFSQLL